MARQAQGAGSRVGFVARVQVVVQDVHADQAAIEVGPCEVEGVVVVEKGAQGFAVVTQAVRRGVETRIGVGVEMVLELALGGQGGSGLGGAVVVAGEAVALGSRVQIVQVGGDFRGAESCVIGRQVVMDATDHRVAVTGHHRGAELVGRRVGGAIGPDLLRRVGRVEHPVGDFLGAQFVVLGSGAEPGPVLVPCTSGFAASDIGQLGGCGSQARDLGRGHNLVRQLHHPGCGGRAGRQYRRRGLALRGAQQRGRGDGGGGELQKVAPCFVRQPVFLVLGLSRILAFHGCAPPPHR
ncbi:hypothetical protein D3C76_928170 [compost metagenome]